MDEIPKVLTIDNAIISLQELAQENTAYLVISSICDLIDES